MKKTKYPILNVPKIPTNSNFDLIKESLWSNQELEVLDLDLQTLLNALKSTIANSAADSDAVGTELDTFDATNTATYGALFTGHGIDNSAYPTPADGRTAAYALIDAIRHKVGLNVTLADRVKYLTYEDSDGTNTIENFSIKAIDTCGNTRDRSLTHNSILLTHSSNACDHSISLTWNNYINWTGGTNHYNSPRHSCLVRQFDNAIDRSL